MLRCCIAAHKRPYDELILGAETALILRAGIAVRIFVTCYRVALAAFHRFNADDGWAIASHIALSTLMALFPFLIVLGSLARWFGLGEVADDAVDLMFQTWPEEVVDRIGNEVHAVLTTNRPGMLTINLVLCVYFASSGVESLRIGLNRAYGAKERRNWIIMRVEAIAYVMVTLASLLTLGFLIVLGPLIFATAVEYAPWLAPLEAWITIARYVIATLVLIVALMLVHAWLPAGRRPLTAILPGIVATLLMWLICGITFGRYLAQFAQTYVTYYSGLSSAMIALVFLYFTALIFIYGGELNHVIAEWRRLQSQVK
jgi:membrane protein